ncbi:hypothetical protein KI387_034796, partial [Taxus chinensis]
MKVFAAMDTGTIHKQVYLVELSGSINGIDLVFLIDSGSNHIFISPKIVKNLNLFSRNINPISVEMADGRIVQKTRALVEDLGFQIDSFTSMESFHVLNLVQYDVILRNDL